MKLALAVALVALVALALCVSGESEKRKRVAHPDDPETELHIEDFSWEVGDIADEICQDICIKSRRRHMLRYCGVLSKSMELALDGIFSSANSVLTHRKTEVHKLYHDPLFMMSLKGQLRKTSTWYLGLTKDEQRKNVSAIVEHFNNAFFQNFVFWGLTGKFPSSGGGMGDNPLGGMDLESMGIDPSSLPGADDGLSPEGRAAIEKMRAGGMGGDNPLAGFGGNDAASTPEGRAALASFHEWQARDAAEKQREAAAAEMRAAEADSEPDADGIW